MRLPPARPLAAGLGGAGRRVELRPRAQRQPGVRVRHGGPVVLLVQRRQGRRAARRLGAPRPRAPRPCAAVPSVAGGLAPDERTARRPPTWSQSVRPTTAPFTLARRGEPGGARDPRTTLRRQVSSRRRACRIVPRERLAVGVRRRARFLATSQAALACRLWLARLGHPAS